MQKSLISEEYRLFLAFLKKVRQDNGVTQERIAKKLKATQSFVSKVERGERRLDVVELRRWCRALGLSLTDFVNGFEDFLKKERHRRHSPENP